MKVIDYDVKKGLEFLDNKKIRISIFKITAVLLVICLNSVNLYEIGRTIAYFNDTESSSGLFSAGVLDFVVNSNKNETDSIVQTATIVKVNNDSLGFQYTVRIEKTSGSDEFCDKLTLEALLEGVSYYSGSLLGFLSLPIVFSTSTDEWEFRISLPEESNPEDSCGFDFVFSGWQTNLSSYGGFSDIERVDDPVYGVASVSFESEEIVGEEFNNSEDLNTIVNEFIGISLLDAMLETELVSEQCDNSHLGLCNTQQLCNSISLYWYSESCHLFPIPIVEPPLESSDEDLTGQAESDLLDILGLTEEVITTEENSCHPEPVDISGCMDNTALNYNSEAIIGNNSCEYFKSEPEPVVILGCIDNSALNFNPEATTNDDSCEYDKAGCVDPDADNYNPEATINDGFCQYPEIIEEQDINLPEEMSYE